MSLSMRKNKYNFKNINKSLFKVRKWTFKTNSSCVKNFVKRNSKIINHLLIYMFFFINTLKNISKCNSEIIK